MEDNYFINGIILVTMSDLCYYTKLLIWYWVVTCDVLSFQSKLDDFVTQEASLNLREQLLSQEKQLLQQQNQWLTNELETKSKELLEVKKEKTACLSDKEMSLTKKDQEVLSLYQTPPIYSSHFLAFSPSKFCCF